MDPKHINPFENKGNAVSDSEIKKIVDHPGGHGLLMVITRNGQSRRKI